MGGILSLRNQEESKIDGYEKYHTQHGGDVEKRKAAYADMVNKYYDLATDFYEWGWGQSFHFAHQRKNETLPQSIARHEHYIALRLKLNPGDKVLDVGCGVGGPLREIALFSGAHIVGLNNNAYQIQRGELHNRRVGLEKTCGYVKADFMNIPLPENSFDGVYQIEATCHAPDKVGVYKEIFRVLKPGKYFAGYDWCMTNKFDHSNAEHQKIKADIEIGNGLPDILTCLQCVEALKLAGFEVEDSFDMQLGADIPWFDALVPRWITLRNLPSTWLGRTVTRNLVFVMECVRLAPKGSVRTQIVLETAADGLVKGGQLAVFTPMFFFLARKPL
eukprot:comp27665_c0_seq1/m.47172 comp27665_c0_seq1/g.47172  ORF comp27665_c0_seq1/g.47172 comp27665_c0_seq1/m.47172 type:complete len:332 (-) comp27665_c0_seq1:111-1106(-)